MKNSICTIITADYGHYALSLHDSIVKFDENASFSVLITKGNLKSEIKSALQERENLQLYFSQELSNDLQANAIKDKYFETYHDAYRWSMKPVFLQLLLERGFSKIIYLDSDIFFFSDFSFLWEQLDNNNLLLSPHWRSSIPEEDATNFQLNFLDGIYNGGFIGASKGAEEALKYWAELCLYKCEVNRKNGFYVDQRYLDILPTRFEKVGSIFHKGCNVANWNQIDCKRTKNEKGIVLINATYPIVFIHFTNTMLKGIFFENDRLLLPYLETYCDNLLKYSEVDIIEDFHKSGKFKKSRNENDFYFQDKDNSGNVLRDPINLLRKIYRKLL